MNVCARTRLESLPNTSRLPARWVVWTPTGIGKLRGSTMVSDTAPMLMNQSCVPLMGMSPFQKFWW